MLLIPSCCCLFKGYNLDIICLLGLPSMDWVWKHQVPSLIDYTNPRSQPVWFLRPHVRGISPNSQLWAPCCLPLFDSKRQQVTIVSALLNVSTVASLHLVVEFCLSLDHFLVYLCGCEWDQVVNVGWGELLLLCHLTPIISNSIEKIAQSMIGKSGRVRIRDHLIFKNTPCLQPRAQENATTLSTTASSI